MANRLHMDEHVLAARLVGPLEKAIAAYAVEPFDLHRLELAGRVRQGAAIGAIGRGMDERGCAGKAADRSIERIFFAWSPRSSRTGTHSMIAPSGTLRRPCSRSTLKWMQDVAVELVADQESKAARRVEPFDAAGDRPPARAPKSCRPNPFRPEPPRSQLYRTLTTAPINMSDSVGKPTFA